MKRFTVAFVLTAILAGSMAFFMPKNFARVASRFPDAEACVYCRQTSLPFSQGGLGKTVFCSAKDLPRVLAQCGGVDGVSVTFEGSQQDVRAVIYKFALANVSVLRLEDLTVVCGFSPRICGGVVVDGKTVNLQIAFRSGRVTVGSPLILGSY